MNRLLRNKTLLAVCAVIAVIVVSALTFLEGTAAHDPARRYEDMRADLATGDFRAANTEASEIALILANRTNEGWLGRDDVDRLPCADILYIDRLFSEASGGRFGLSAQRDVLETLPAGGADGARLSETPDRLVAFGDAVGWRKNGEWLTYDAMTFSPEDAPKGHLPVFKPEDGIRAPFKSRDGRPQTGGALFDLLEQRLGQCATAAAG
ncbi:GUN4 domain-containing protein [Martelella soudanensis]|uniref:GUN4 domain-containing protein n=1 Tax=unclassified Martelella TaxID=2629616 RepID=UPI0015E04F0C|nr:MULTISPECIES: GUN4 domain-containing protein [unclassified Martelella]